jgi:mono/diheme cytochrome c family protein
MRFRAVRLSLAYLLAAALSSCSLFGQDAGKRDSPVTSVVGESWLVHLRRTFDDTSMGKTGRLGPPAPVQDDSGSRALLVSHSSHRTVVSGSDLYRLNCRGCHGEFGQGAPPEINAVIDPVRASSVTAVMERMKTSGAAISRSEATKLAAQSRAALLQRLHNGGQDMPAFPYLNETEVSVLLGYLRELAEVPEAQRKPGPVRESSLRVGELIVKSTCHTCHSATGENPSPQQLFEGAIPPLSTLTTRNTQAAFIRKVTQGAPVLMGTPPLMYRGRMPVFYYLSEEEAADVYDYLVSFPPRATVNTDTLTARQIDDLAPKDPSNPVAGSGNVNVNGALTGAQHSQDAEMDRAIVLPIAGLLAFLLLAGGFALTVRAMKRLAAQDDKPATVAQVTHREPSAKRRIQDGFAA